MEKALLKKIQQFAECNPKKRGRSVNTENINEKKEASKGNLCEQKRKKDGQILYYRTGTGKKRASLSKIRKRSLRAKRATENKREQAQKKQAKAQNYEAKSIQTALQNKSFRRFLAENLENKSYQRSLVERHQGLQRELEKLEKEIAELKGKGVEKQKREKAEVKKGTRKGATIAAKNANGGMTIVVQGEHKSISDKAPKEKLLEKEHYVEVNGDKRKEKVYVAKITGTDPKFGLKREFVSLPSSGGTISGRISLKDGDIIELAGGGSWKNKFVRYQKVIDGKLKYINAKKDGSLEYSEEESRVNLADTRHVLKSLSKKGE